MNVLKSLQKNVQDGGILHFSVNTFEEFATSPRCKEDKTMAKATVEIPDERLVELDGYK